MVLIVDKPSTLLGELTLQRRLSIGIKAALSQADDFQCNNGHKDLTRPECKTWNEMA